VGSNRAGRDGAHRASIIETFELRQRVAGAAVRLFDMRQFVGKNYRLSSQFGQLGGGIVA
jgi:hypothetical protein